ncbi:MAG: hypothetical protein DME24_13255 [Verrucomicrobia bacterium]|nr:MAG: hypothetical protein DME24_13255 [Verrucomicrobiota bacterium]
MHRPQGALCIRHKSDGSSRGRAVRHARGRVHHQGEDCTYETLLRRFGLRDRAAQQIGEMIHDADLEDGKFQRAEGFGLDRVLKGWAKLNLSDAEILAKGFDCFEALYNWLRK